jgi:D-glycero-alpha-D-manno-heptose-7-phosphate kinase
MLIITKTPLRVSFCGGGSDMAVFYEKHGGCVLSTSINKYVYIFVNPGFYKDRVILKYTKLEEVRDIKEIEHPIFKYLLNAMGISGVELTSVSDIPAGAGLGSSSSFTVGLLNALHIYQGKDTPRHPRLGPQFQQKKALDSANLRWKRRQRLAEEACSVEIEKLGSPIGKQDQYAAAFGGLNFIGFNKDGSVTVEPLSMKEETYDELQANLMMLPVGTFRSANAILAEQKKNINDDRKANNLIEMCRLAGEMKGMLQKDDLSSFGKILHESWLLKQSLASGISNTDINEIYNSALSAGATGGKLLGAGGGGFLLLYCEKDRQRRVCETLDLTPLEFKFESCGTSIVYA